MKGKKTETMKKSLRNYRQCREPKGSSSLLKGGYVFLFGGKEGKE